MFYFKNPSVRFVHGPSPQTIPERPRIRGPTIEMATFRLVSPRMSLCGSDWPTLIGPRAFRAEHGSRGRGKGFSALAEGLVEAGALGEDQLSFVGRHHSDPQPVESMSWLSEPQKEPIEGA